MDTASSILYGIVRDHFETFRAHATSLRDGDGLPRFVEQEFRDFLLCGWLAGGFARFRCATCGLDRHVPFSCKGRGFCPSYGGRRMAERAAHLVDHVFPDVPVRPWVLSVPHRLRYQLRRLPARNRMGRSGGAGSLGTCESAQGMTFALRCR